MKNIFSHFYKVNNAGDRYCCPFDYFKFENAERINFLDLNIVNSNLINFPNLVFGGGGMLHDTFIDTFRRFTVNAQRNKLVFWGAGINEHGLDKQYFPTFLNKFNLVGLRDYDNPWEYVPCVSCMDPVFDQIKPPITDFVIYNHCDHDIPIQTVYKRNNNLKIEENLGTVINFLALGSTIITNSYHGAYWGLLMNRKVLIFEPFSNRFFGFKNQPIICDRDNWREKLKIDTKTYLNYLIECRQININFKIKVLELFD